MLLLVLILGLIFSGMVLVLRGSKGNGNHLDTIDLLPLILLGIISSNLFNLLFIFQIVPPFPPIYWTYATLVFLVFLGILNSTFHSQFLQSYAIRALPSRFGIPSERWRRIFTSLLQYMTVLILLVLLSTEFHPLFTLFVFTLQAAMLVSIVILFGMLMSAFLPAINQRGIGIIFLFLTIFLVANISAMVWVYTQESSTGNFSTQIAFDRTSVDNSQSLPIIQGVLSVKPLLESQIYISFSHLMDVEVQGDVISSSTCNQVSSVKQVHMRDGEKYVVELTGEMTLELMINSSQPLDPSTNYALGIFEEGRCIPIAL